MKRLIKVALCCTLVIGCERADDKPSTPSAETAAAATEGQDENLEATTEAPAVTSIDGTGDFNVTGYFSVMPTASGTVISLNLTGNQRAGVAGMGMSMPLAEAEVRALMAGDLVNTAGRTSFMWGPRSRQLSRAVESVRLEGLGHGVSRLTLNLGGELTVFGPPQRVTDATRRVSIKGQFWAACAVAQPEFGDATVTMDPSLRTPFCRDAVARSDLGKLES